MGNRFLLSERQRLAIARSVATDEQLKERKGKMRASFDGGEVWVDGFNTVITLEVLFSDSLLFSCMDGTVRDLAALRGTYRMIPETTEAVRLLFDVLEELGAGFVHVLLDEPVSNSGRLKTLIAEIHEGRPFGLDVRILKEVDKALYDRENVVTSDSIILDHCRSWVDLMPVCVEKRGANLLRVWE